MDVRAEDPATPDIAQLLREHLEDMHRHSPPESVHALDLDGLRGPDMTFWSVRQGPVLLGCGALKHLEPEHGEIKSMRTVTAHLRKGVAAKMLAYILDEARRRAYRRLSLETGSMEAFLPARSLYERHGFRYCGPFGDYVEDPYSVFMTREL
jgi:putative acetyltransferase